MNQTLHEVSAASTPQPVQGIGTARTTLGARYRNCPAQQVHSDGTANTATDAWHGPKHTLILVAFISYSKAQDHAIPYDVYSAVLSIIQFMGYIKSISYNYQLTTASRLAPWTACRFTYKLAHP